MRDRFELSVRSNCPMPKKSEPETYVRSFGYALHLSTKMVNKNPSKTKQK